MLPKHNYIRTNIIGFRAISCENTAQIWRKLLLVAKLPGKFVFGNTTYLMPGVLVDPTNPKTAQCRINWY